jgi:hypothetical protein
MGTNGPRPDGIPGKKYLRVHTNQSKILFCACAKMEYFTVKFISISGQRNEILPNRK